MSQMNSGLLFTLACLACSTMAQQKDGEFTYVDSFGYTHHIVAPQKKSPSQGPTTTSPEDEVAYVRNLIKRLEAPQKSPRQGPTTTSPGERTYVDSNGYTHVLGEPLTDGDRRRTAGSSRWEKVAAAIAIGAAVANEVAFANACSNLRRKPVLLLTAGDLANLQTCVAYGY